MTITATEAKSRFGHLLDNAQREPVVIEKNGREFAVMLSKHDYDALQTELQELRSELETAFLMQGENGKHLRESLNELKEGRVITTTTDEVDALVSDEG
jgi:prevent-host-death family protein